MTTLSVASYLLAMPVLIAACTVQSAFGFGLALIAVPLLSLRLPLALVTPLLALLSMTLGVTIAWRSHSAIRFDLGWRLLASAAVGVPFGIALIVVLDGDVVRFALGVVVLLVGLHGLRDERSPRREPGTARWMASREPTVVSWTVWPLGFVTGVLGGAYNLMGPPLVLFLQHSRLDPSAFRATLHAFAFAINGVIVAGWVIGGSMVEDVEMWQLIPWYLSSLLPLAIGGWFGGRIALCVDVVRYRQVVHGLLAITGATLVLPALS